MVYSIKQAKKYIPPIGMQLGWGGEVRLDPGPSVIGGGVSGNWTHYRDSRDTVYVHCMLYFQTSRRGTQSGH